MVKKVLAITISFIIILTLGGCGSSQSKEQSTFDITASPSNSVMTETNSTSPVQTTITTDETTNSTVEVPDGVKKCVDEFFSCISENDAKGVIQLIGPKSFLEKTVGDLDEYEKQLSQRIQAEAEARGVVSVEITKCVKLPTETLSKIEEKYKKYDESITVQEGYNVVFDEVYNANESLISKGSDTTIVKIDNKYYFDMTMILTAQSDYVEESKKQNAKLYAHTILKGSMAVATDIAVKNPAAGDNEIADLLNSDENYRAKLIEIIGDNSCELPTDFRVEDELVVGFSVICDGYKANYVGLDKSNPFYVEKT